MHEGARRRVNQPFAGSIAHVSAPVGCTRIEFESGSLEAPLQVRQHAYSAFDVLPGYGDDFFADTMKS
ncbi:MAG TPA: hypothetical protein VN750_15025, partial [Steroidobacteraceae bacterium]|nr:hypothetical protein [Steroidobacteraceae bacterium]